LAFNFALVFASLCAARGPSHQSTRHENHIVQIAGPRERPG
jgi:hypothetical protein